MIVGSLFNYVVFRIFYNFLPLCPDFLVLNLREAPLDSSDQVVLLVTFGQLECLLNDEISVAVADELRKSRRLSYLLNESRASASVSILKALFNDARRVLLNAQLEDLVG